MTISNKHLVEAINNGANFGGTKTEDKFRLAEAANSLVANAKYSVPTLADLPDATLNTGRFIFVDAVGDYRYSNGEEWTRNYDTTLVTQEDMWSWGTNGNGQLGDGTTVSKSSPVSVVGGFTDWCQVDSGFRHSIGLRQNGTLWAWGSNNYGQFGNNTTIQRSSPVSVVGGFTDWCQVSAGWFHSAAVRTNGTLWSWGCNGAGRLGDGTSVNKSSPVSVVGGFSDWCQVSAGCAHTAAVRTNGTLWTWGCNNYGQIGDGTTVNKSSPVSVIGGFTDWCQVASGESFTTAVRASCSIMSWGFNGQGQLGDNSSINKSSPVITGAIYGQVWLCVSAKRSTAIALSTYGSLYGWGVNGNGQIGNGSTISTSYPSPNLGGFTDWCSFTSGYAHSVGVRANGTLWAWGWNASGQLGDGTTNSRSIPVSVITPASTVWRSASAGRDFSAAVSTTTKRGFNTP